MLGEQELGWTPNCAVPFCSDFCRVFRIWDLHFHEGGGREESPSPPLSSPSGSAEAKPSFTAPEGKATLWRVWLEGEDGQSLEWAVILLLIAYRDVFAPCYCTATSSSCAKRLPRAAPLIEGALTHFACE